MSRQCWRRNFFECQVIQMNDHVYEVYATMSPLPNPGSPVPGVELVFVHGLQEDASATQSYLTAWSKRDNLSICWLNAWLPNHLQADRIPSVSYDASVLKIPTEGRLDMYLTAESLVSSLIDLGKVGQRCPVVLVGHSLGGLVIKEVCNRAHKYDGKSLSEDNVYRKFLESVKGLFFYSIPNKGSTLQLVKLASATHSVESEM